MKGALTVAGGVFIHVALGILFTFGEYELVNRHNRPTLPNSIYYSHGWIPLFWFAKEYIKTKVTRHTNDDEYELFTHVHTSKCVVILLFPVTPPQANIIVTRQVSDLKM